MPETQGILRLFRAFLPDLYLVRWRVAAVAVLEMLSPAISVMLLALMKTFIDEVIVAGNIEPLPRLALAYAGLMACRLTAAYRTALLDASIVEGITQSVRVRTYAHLIAASPGTFRKYSVGDLLAHLAGDVERVEILVYSAPMSVASNAVRVVYYLAFLLFLSPLLTAVALLVGPALFLVNWRFSSRMRRLARIARRKASAWLALAEERMGALPLIQAFGGETLEERRFDARSTALRRAQLRNVALQTWAGTLTEILGALGGLVVLGVGAYQAHVGTMTAGALLAFLGSVGSLFGPLSSLARAQGRFERAAAGAQRVQELLGTASLVTDAPGAKPLVRPRGELEFRDVRFAYPDGHEALRGISFRVRPGETVALVGENGSGKTTLLHLALRLLDPSHGSIHLDGIDLRDVTLASLRGAVAAVFQEPYVLRGSIADNIRYGLPSADQDQLRAAARVARVAAFAERMKGGLDSPGGPRGGWLSGGQRQRIALARAFVRNAPVLLLDEATASLDSEAEALIQETIAELAGRRTILVVAHRLSSVRRADRVIVLEQGRIAETGTPAELQKRMGRFRALFTDQIRAEPAGT
jgi:ABC-type multidrug transport system fused ATPase/permease subunit